MPVPTLPSVADQAEKLIELGATGPLAPDVLRKEAAALPGGPGLLVVAGLRPSALAPLLRRAGRPGFVVEDMTDADDFAPTAEVPDAPVWLLTDPGRGDDLQNASPAEAEVEFAARDRLPMLLTEGVQWALQAPDVLERNHCFMTTGSRLRKATGRFDARTPAVWISNGTGRDGRDRRDAPKVGWCWWNNRHTWLGFGSGAARLVGPAPAR
ncbi:MULTISPECIES: DUF5701 family protein [unclassified Pseudonocardia]|uniref:DUF5701 family protein n=1 Tax=unclassified Pseudonocardia TaxID=2619320 RepID=UPI0001FFDED3|nr:MULTISPECIES: DUF5701 family protein [unclassified Pseudonocardia]ALE75054.1 hypothetical protein FRP1_22860 [Pseudonocardia sp. EC080625-04]ALL74405.1 hypothetical protein AD006_02050 [Pseudonocardia sp. EC080610-09]ALL81427.1 hypothetical protein AD017_09875 [Pseudonocardia sp. EC080619-01]OLM16374.1 hypothetical protein Ae707Ps1_0632 [Pseudonocardia sp. Ae707_Ps1]